MHEGSASGFARTPSGGGIGQHNGTASPINSSPIGPRLYSIRQTLASISLDVHEFENRLNGKPPEPRNEGNKIGEYPPMSIEDMLGIIEQHIHDITICHQRLAGRF